MCQVDPGLLLLPRLRAAGQKFSPLDQLLCEEEPSNGQQGRRGSGPAASKSGTMPAGGSGEADGTQALARLFCRPPPAASEGDGGAGSASTVPTMPPPAAIALGLERLCDVKDLDDLGVFYRLNEAKVEAWLKGKVRVRCFRSVAA